MTGAGSGEQLIPRVKNEIRAVRTALWFRPSAYCIIAALTAAFVATVDGFLPPHILAWLPEVEVSTVTELLKLMAGSMLTVATVTLSVLMLVLSLAAGQASPRAVPEIMADPVTQNALGTFLATFTFALAALLLFGFGAVAGPGVTLIFFGALFLVLNALRYLVQWIHHVADTLKINRMLHRIHRQAKAVLQAYLEMQLKGDGEAVEAAAGEETQVFPKATGYVQLIDAGRLHDLARAHDLSVRLCVQEGDFVHDHRSLMLLRGSRADDEVCEALRATVVVGFERSHEGDPRLGFELLAEVACRALSPGINDPQTALAAIEYLGSLLALAAVRPAADYPACTTPDGRVTFLHPDFGALVERALRPVVRDGAGEAEVIAAVMQVLCDLAACAAPDHLDAILEEAERAEAFGMSALTLERDKEAFCEKVQELRDHVAGRRR
ncbi:DUF2254 domain-containing protein [Pelagibius marinus]|uniref:DUF2254 domain-containing protein n=1 Tax=Pelagibius marinus TaxID=2762760 RepID=UPI001872C3E0|nr:DUF2254 domain-containing protein [Pelagibius marinus]